MQIDDDDGDRHVSVVGLDVHPLETAILVHCDVSASLIQSAQHSQSQSSPTLSRTRRIDRTIRIDQLDAGCDLLALADTMIDECNGLLDVKHRSQLLQLLRYLQKRPSAVERLNGSALGSIGSGVITMPNDARRARTATGRVVPDTARISPSPSGWSNCSGSSSSSRPTSPLSTNAFGERFGCTQHVQRVLQSLSTQPGLESLASIANDDQLNDTLLLNHSAFDCINVYVESLYDESIERLQSLAKICKLSTQPANLLPFLDHQPLMGALSRLLREDCRKQPELAALILSFFACVCYYRNLQETVSSIKVGSSCLELCDFALQKELQLQPEQRRGLSAGLINGTTGATNIGSSIGFPFETNQMMIGSGRLRNFGSEHEQLTSFTIDATSPTNQSPSPVQMRGSLLKHSISSDQVRKLVHSASSADLLPRKLLQLQKRHNTLFESGLLLLLHLSDDERSLQKMLNRNLVTLLLHMLQREQNTSTLGQLSLYFLHRLSIRLVAKQQMSAQRVLFYLQPHLFSDKIDSLSLQSLLQLMFNLSFDHRLRLQMLTIGFLPRLVQLLIKQRFRSEKLIICILYQMSIDPASRGQFACTLSTGRPLVQVLIQRALQLSERLNTQLQTGQCKLPFQFAHCCVAEYLCLVINLVSSESALAAQTAENATLSRCIEFALPIQPDAVDPVASSRQYLQILYTKLLRALSAHDLPYQALLNDRSVDFVRLAIDQANQLTGSFHSSEIEDESSEENVSLAGIGSSCLCSDSLHILARRSKMNWAPILAQHPIESLLLRLLQPANAYESELVVQGFLLAGTICLSDRSLCQHFIQNGLAERSLQWLRSEFDASFASIQTQCVHLLAIWAGDAEIGVLLLQKWPVLIDELVKLLSDRNGSVRAASEQVLELLGEQDASVMRKLQKARFQRSNLLWLEMVSADRDGGHVLDNAFDVQGEFQLGSPFRGRATKNRFPFDPEPDSKWTEDLRTLNTQSPDPEMTGHLVEKVSKVPLRRKIPRPLTGYKNRLVKFV